jgi:hypothetical protein
VSRSPVLFLLGPVRPHPTAPVVFTASDDHTARIWRKAAGAEAYQTAFVLKDHAAAVRGLAGGHLRP